MFTEPKKKLILISSTIDFPETFLYKIVSKLNSNFETHLLTNINKNKINNLKNIIKISHIPFSRKINIFNDFLCLILFCFKFLLLGKEKNIISMTPKGALYGTLSKLLSPKSKRVHIFTGQVWSNYKGIKRLFFINIDKLTIKFSDTVFFDSRSQINYLRNNNFKICNAKLISQGSIKGVDTNIFKYNFSNKIKYKKLFKLKKNSSVLMYIGRLNYDKGITDLIDVFRQLKKANKNLYLFLIGKDEMNISDKINGLDYQTFSSIHLLNYRDDIYNYLNFADILCLPSKREGFGSVVIEASSIGIPVIGGNIYGTRDCLINNFNGLRYKLHSKLDFKIKLNKLLIDKNFRQRLGINGRNFVSKKFREDTVISNFYDQLLNSFK